MAATALGGRVELPAAVECPKPEATGSSPAGDITPSERNTGNDADAVLVRARYAAPPVGRGVQDADEPHLRVIVIFSMVPEKRPFSVA